MGTRVRLAGAPSSWTGLGDAGGPVLEGAELRLVEVPFRRPVRTARGVHRRRPLALVRLVARAGGAEVSGWGECAALAGTDYDAEDASGAFATLERRLVPALFGVAAGRSGAVPGPSGLGAVAAAAPGAPLAWAALEMAVADLHLRASGRSLAGLLGVAGRTVPAGAVAGESGTVDELLEQVGALVAAGYRRVKLKIGPGWDVEPVAAVVRAHPGLAVQVDANGSYREEDVPVLEALDRTGVACIEQPFARDDLEAHARLARRIGTPLCLDESADSPARVVEALAMGACSVVCVKPARLGGIGAALSVIRTCHGAGVPAWLGGMFESGYARGVNATLAALPGVTWPGDLAPAPSYLADDLVAAARGGGGPSPGGLEVPVPAGPGMGPAPDRGTLERLTSHAVRLAPEPAG